MVKAVAFKNKKKKKKKKELNQTIKKRKIVQPGRLFKIKYRYFFRRMAMKINF